MSRAGFAASAVLSGLLIGAAWGLYVLHVIATQVTPVPPPVLCQEIETQTRPPYALIPVGPVIRVCAPGPTRMQ